MGSTLEETVRGVWETSACVQRTYRFSAQKLAARDDAGEFTATLNKTLDMDSDL